MLPLPLGQWTTAAPAARQQGRPPSAPPQAQQHLALLRHRWTPLQVRLALTPLRPTPLISGPGPAQLPGAQPPARSDCLLRGGVQSLLRRCSSLC